MAESRQRLSPSASRPRWAREVQYNTHDEADDDNADDAEADDNDKPYDKLNNKQQRISEGGARGYVNRQAQIGLRGQTDGEGRGMEGGKDADAITAVQG